MRLFQGVRDGSDCLVEGHILLWDGMSGEWDVVDWPGVQVGAFVCVCVCST